MLACDATRIPLLTDGTRLLATGDAHTPISLALRRADGSPRPGLPVPRLHQPYRPHRPAPRHPPRSRRSNHTSQSGCRCAGRITAWSTSTTGHSTLTPNGILTVRHGRRRFTSRPRLRPPPPTRTPPPGHHRPPGQDRPPDRPTGIRLSTPTRCPYRSDHPPGRRHPGDHPVDIVCQPIPLNATPQPAQPHSPDEPAHQRVIGMSAHRLD